MNAQVYRLVFQGGQVLRLVPNLRWCQTFLRASLFLERLISARLVGVRDDLNAEWA